MLKWLAHILSSKTTPLTYKQQWKNNYFTKKEMI